MGTFKTPGGIQDSSPATVFISGLLTPWKVYFPCHTDCPLVKSLNLSETLFASSDVKWVSSNLPHGLTG